MKTFSTRTLFQIGAWLGGLCLLAGLDTTPAQAQKKLQWEYTGSVSSSLVAAPDLIPDVYSFEAKAGESFTFHTSLTSLDTTIRVVGPNAAIDLFNDDRNSSDLTSHITLTAPVSGTYFVIVSTYYGDPSGGDYALNFERQPCDPANPCIATAAARSKAKKK